MLKMLNLNIIFSDMSNWEDCFVPDVIVKALEDLKFATPTPIQSLAIPSAIRDHRDILGAAETVSLINLSM